jgi:hypothetical protein
MSLVITHEIAVHALKRFIVRATQRRLGAITPLIDTSRVGVYGNLPRLHATYTHDALNIHIVSSLSVSGEYVLGRTEFRRFFFETKNMLEVNSIDIGISPMQLVYHPPPYLTA